MIQPASLRSERDRHAVGTSDRDQIGITVHLHRNPHYYEVSTHPDEFPVVSGTPFSFIKTAFFPDAP
ncbi:MAG TPA: hypothetical protein VI455_13515, partial [Terriglobia bacterium]